MSGFEHCSYILIYPSVPLFEDGYPGVSHSSFYRTLHFISTSKSRTHTHTHISNMFDYCSLRSCPKIAPARDPKECVCERIMYDHVGWWWFNDDDDDDDDSTMMMMMRRRRRRKRRKRIMLRTMMLRMMMWMMRLRMMMWRMRKCRRWGGGWWCCGRWGGGWWCWGWWCQGEGISRCIYLKIDHDSWYLEVEGLCKLVMTRGRIGWVAMSSWRGTYMFPGTD